MAIVAGQERLLIDAYIVGVKLRTALESGQSLCTAFQQLAGPFDLLDDGYPEWHPAPHSFKGIVRLFLYREPTGGSYRALTKYPELADAFGLEKIPDESVLSRTWRNRFDEATRSSSPPVHTTSSKRSTTTTSTSPKPDQKRQS